MATEKAITCKETTGRGTLCTRKAGPDGYCTQHGSGPVARSKSQQKRITAQRELVDTASGEVIVQEEAESALSKHPDFVKFEIAKRIAHTLANSSLVPDAYRGRPNDVFVAINMGREVGLGEFAAVQSIAVIDGKPCLYGDGLIGVVRASPKCMWIEESLSEDGLTATCKTQRKGDPNTTAASYSMDDAIQAGINTKFNWKKHPKRMLQMRARAYCLRDAYPDLLKGLGVVEERQDHEDTPPPVTDYKLPTPSEQWSKPMPVVLEGVTLAEVERAIHQSDTMEELLNAGNMAKLLPEMDQGTARITYKKMRKVLKEDEDVAQN